PEPAFYPYFQTYTIPGTDLGTGDVHTRKALIAALELEDYSKGVVFRHEQTLRGPKQDRLELMRATRLHCELIFLLYDDVGGEIAGLLDHAASGTPVARLQDEYSDTHV